MAQKSVLVNNMERQLSPSLEDREEGEFLSGEESDDPGAPAQSARFFRQEDYQYLLTKTLSTLDLDEYPSADDKSGTQVNPKNIHQGNRESFPHGNKTEEMFPFPEYFEQQLKNEWVKPASNMQFSPFFKKLYELPQFASKLLQVPLMDAPVAALQFSDLLSEDGQEYVRDHWDKWLEAALWRNREDTAMVIKHAQLHPLYHML